MQYEDILRHVGAFGKYQKLMIFVIAIIRLPAAFHYIGQVFVAPSTDHWCVVPGSQAINCSQLQLNSVAECQEEQKLISIPYELDPEGNQVYSSCERYVMNDEDTGTGLNSTDVIPCDAGWDFDRSRYKSTINEDFSLVCDRENFSDIAQSVWFAGLLAGSLVWGTLGDWIGRRRAFILSLLLVTVSSTVTAFVPNFAAYTAMRFITAACAYGTSLVTLIIGTEIVGPKKRVMVSMATMFFFSLGYIILSLLAFLFREWRHLQLAISLPYVPAFLLIVVLPESPRWLISKGRVKEATRIIEKIAEVNGTKAPENLLDNLFQSKQEDKHHSRFPVTQLDLVRTPNIRKKTLILFFDWFVVNMAYYGLALGTSSLGIDDYIAAFIAGAVDIPSYLLCWYVMERFGRRLTLAAFYVSSGLSCLITIFIPLGAAKAAVAMVGKFAMAAAFGHIYIYSCELYPTVIRSIGLGTCSMVARVSGILCPIILILGKYWEPLPLCIFGASSILAGFLSLMLPETMGCSLPDTIQDGENFGKGQSFQLCYKRSPQGGNGDPTQSAMDYVPLSTLEKTSIAPEAV